MSTSPTPIALPVTAVTCLEDRALVERSAVLDLEPGTRTVRLGPVSALAVDRSLHAEVPAGHPAAVLDARIVRERTPREPGPAAGDSALRHRLHALEEEHRAVTRERERLGTRLDLLGRLAADLLRDIAEGAGLGETDRDRWTRELDRVDGERDTCGERLRAADARLAALGGELSDVRHALDLAETEPPGLLAHIELTVRAATAGPVPVRLTHLTPAPCGGRPTGPCSTGTRSPWTRTRWSGSVPARTGRTSG